MQSHGLICIKVRTCDKHVDHSSRKRGILGNNHVHGSSEHFKHPGECGTGDALLRSSVDTAQLITALIHQNIFI